MPLLYNYQMTKRIFTFWEPKESIPGYLELCLESWQNFLPDYEIVILDYSNLSKWLGENYYPDFLYRNFSLPIQSDAIRCAILKKYGGVWMDVDTIITKPDIKKIMETNADFAIIAPHICFICAKANSNILNKWEKRIKKRIEFANKALKNKLLLKYIYPKLYKRVTNWSYLGNDILNRLINQPETNCLKLNRDELHAMPEFEHAGSFKKPVKIYQKFYFESEHSDFVLRENKGIILLHNSWTPEKYKAMTKEEFLKTNNTLAQILKNTLKFYG